VITKKLIMSLRIRRGLLKNGCPALLSAALLVALVVFEANSSTRTESAYAADATSLYNRQCANCHGRDGRSKTSRGRRSHARDLTSGEWQDDVSDERIYNSISHGKGKMPGFKKLSESQIDSLVSYVRRLRR
jgi:mono/diheme cytochrome c family protein